MSQNEQINRIQVSIFGEEHTLKGPASPEHLRRLAKYVDNKMQQINNSAPRLGTSRIAVLAALNIADELFRLRRELQALQSQMNRKTPK